MKSSKTKVFMILAGLLSLSIFLTGGCKNLMGAGDVSAPSTQPAAAPEPVVVDGVRTSYADIVDKVAPAVVKITSEHKEKAQQMEAPEQALPFPFGDQQPQKRGPSIQRGLGSGVIVSADGTILTNNHVIEGAEKVQVEMTDKRSFDAKVVGADKLSDLALLKVDAKDLPYLN